MNLLLNLFYNHLPTLTMNLYNQAINYLNLYLFFISSLSLTGCNKGNQWCMHSKPTPRNPSAAIKLYNQNRHSVTTHQLVSYEGHQVTFYKQRTFGGKDIWFAKVAKKLPPGCAHIVNLPVFLGGGFSIDQLLAATPRIQKKYLQVTLPTKHRNGFVYIRPLSKRAYAQPCKGAMKRSIRASSNVLEELTAGVMHRLPKQVTFRKQSIEDYINIPELSFFASDSAVREAMATLAKSVANHREARDLWLFKNSRHHWAVGRAKGTLFVAEVMAYAGYTPWVLKDGGVMLTLTFKVPHVKDWFDSDVVGWYRIDRSQVKPGDVVVQRDDAFNGAKRRVGIVVGDQTTVSAEIVGNPAIDGRIVCNDWGFRPGDEDKVRLLRYRNNGRELLQSLMVMG